MKHLNFTYRLKTIFLLPLLMVLCMGTTNAQIDITIGTGTASNTSTSYPTPYGDYFEGSRTQYLFRASELLAAGMNAGVILGLRWNIVNTNGSGVHELFEVSIGTTTMTTLTSYVTGLTNVYPATNYTPVGGVVTYMFPAPFVWNGVDNIVVQTCHGSPSNSVCCYCNPSQQYTTNASVNYTPTSFQSVYYTYQDCAGNLCGSANGNTSNTTYRANTTFIYGMPCTGVPTTSVSGPDSVCPKTTFNLGFTTFYTGITVDWEKSTDGGMTWVAATGTTNAAGVHTDMIYVPTWYRAKIKCLSSNQTYITPVHLVDIKPFYYCYCTTSKGTATAGIDVGNVKVISGGGDTLLNNGTGTPVENNTTAKEGYSEFRYLVPPAPMYPDSTYNFWAQQINSGSFVNGIGTIFIDYNRNGTFDYYERVFTQTTMNVLPNPGLVGTTGWQVPKDSFKYYGLTGMRVIMRDGTNAPDSCLTYGNGETEDYLIDLRYKPCDAAPNAGTIEGDTSMCAGYDYILTDTSYQKKRHGIERFWQISGDGVDWYDITGSFNKDTAKRTFTGQPLYYRVGAVCTHTDDTSYTPTHKVNLKPTYKCYCHSQSTGTFEDTSDIGAFQITNFAVGNTGAHLLNPSAWYRRQDYTDMAPIKLDVDSVYGFHVFHTMPKNMHADAKVTVFVDFNNNKRYDIPDERIFTGFTSIGYHTVVKNLVIPNNVIVNVPTGMRIIINNDVAPNIPSDSACGEYISGETEDFIVMFKREFEVRVQDINKGLEHVDVFPNPTTGKFTMQFRSTTAKEVKVTVTSVTGQVVLQQTYQHDGDVFRRELDLGNHAKGLYIVQIDAGTEKVTRRLTVQ